ncbi:hypothetical protein J7I80_10650 [Bacillus sp. ISL-41]|uniref:hypothetical protein n=1 Tax=Bacillus sp. ISL-41 TaxID=2819127 RepID=UPI001BE8D51B|nr:hypothetical protein [Bacillus sp. ISL-41]MBT2642686.1 hypothetical protein [Bacillus sp. ISL-41]
MKSFFDFIGRTEASRGARRWSWTKKSGSTLVSPSKRYKPKTPPHVTENCRALELDNLEINIFSS